MGFFGLNSLTSPKSGNRNIDLLQHTFDTSTLNTQQHNTSTDAMYSGIDWLYTYVEAIYMYDYTIVYF